MYIPKPIQNEQDGNSLSRVIEQIGVEKENLSDTDSSSENSDAEQSVDLTDVDDKEKIETIGPN